MLECCRYGSPGFVDMACDASDKLVVSTLTNGCWFWFCAANSSLMRLPRSKIESLVLSTTGSDSDPSKILLAVDSLLSNCSDESVRGEAEL